MTASLPLPDDSPPVVDGGEDTEAAPQVASPTPRPPRRPSTSARSATGARPAERKPAAPRAAAAKKPAAPKAGTGESAQAAAKQPAAKQPAAKKPAARKPAAKTPAVAKPAPRKKPEGAPASPAPATDEAAAVPEASSASPAQPTVPGPPPPLPEDLVIPPRPPLPPVPPLPAEAAAPAAPEDAATAAPTRRDEVDAPASVVAAAPAVEVPIEPAPEPEPELDIEAAPAIEAVPAIEPEPEPEPRREPQIEGEAEDRLHPDPVDAHAPLAPVEAEPEQVDVEPVVVPSGPATAGASPQAQPVLAAADEDAAEALVATLPPPAADADAPALTLRGVTKSFGGAVAVDGLNLSVPAGSFYGIVGPNGAGKTTTLSMIAGLLRPDAGVITVNGIDVRSRSTQAKRAMGVLPDRLRTFDRLTGRQLLYYYGVLRGLPSAVVESRIGDLARAFDLVDALGRSVSDYSAGMTKKVMLAGAMIHSPRLLVLDEPFESVDPVSSAVILDILTTYVAHGGTVILSSHGMELVERVCSRVAVLVAGQVLAEGTIDEVRGEGTLQERFLELAGGPGDVEGLEWLHSFSD